MKNETPLNYLMYNKLNLFSLFDEYFVEKCALIEKVIYFSKIKTNSKDKSRFCLPFTHYPNRKMVSF